MRNNMFKKITAAVMSLTMILGTTGVVMGAHAANGANVATNTQWSSFSICTREDGGTWEDALIALPQEKFKDYWTEGWVADDAELSASSVNFYVACTGWDGQYVDGIEGPVGDNPWGLWFAGTGIPIEKGRYYDISFKIKSSLKASVAVKDDEGNETGEKKDMTLKHISFKAYDPISRGEPSVAFESITSDKVTSTGDDRVSPDGMILLDSSDSDWMTVKARIKIPQKQYAAEVVGFKFACGAFLVTYPDEIALKGYINVKDFEVKAGNQYTVKYTNGVTSSSKYVNEGDSVTSMNMPKAGYTLTGFTSNGSKYTFGTPVKSDLTLTAAYTKTAAPAAPKFSAKSRAKKKVSVTITKTANAVGYEVQCAKKKNMKGAKKGITTKTTYTVKGMKSKKLAYVKVRGYNVDSAGNKVFGKLSKAKKVYVK